MKYYPVPEMNVTDPVLVREYLNKGNNIVASRVLAT
jgi:hypothetical protein